MMMRVIFLIITGLFVAVAASWLSSQQGDARIIWLGRQIEIETSLLVVGIGALCLISVFIDRLVRLLFRWPHLFSAGWQARRRAKGETALSLGFVALAAGDKRAATRQARRAEKLLDKGILTDLLSAQSAHATGDVKAASRYFKKLAGAKETAYFGQLGLMRLHQGADSATGQVSQQALLAAQKAFALDPTSAEAAQLILKQALLDEKWQKATDCLKVYMNSSGGQSDSEIAKAKALYARLLTKQAEEALAEGAGKTAQSLLEDALNEAPDFTPALYQLAHYLHQKGDKRGAKKIADKGFIKSPQNIMIELQQAIRPQNDGQLISHLMSLAGKSQHKDDAYLATASYAINAGIWASASQALGQLSDDCLKTNHYYLIKAAIASATDKHEEADEALRAAAIAPRSGQWHCGVCTESSDSYDFICSGCGSAGQMSWHWPAHHSISVVAPE